MAKMVSCDSSSIITLSTNCLLWLLDKFDAEFLIPVYVRKEIIDNPRHTRKYAFEALRNGLMVGNGLRVEKTDAKLRNKITELSNTLYMHKGKPIEIIQAGEADALALAVEKDIKTLLVDEKNTRLLLEDKELLRQVVQKRTHRNIEVNGGVAKELDHMLEGINAIRSSELVAVAIKRGILDWPYPKKELLNSTLTAIKFGGCAITSEEITEITNIIAPTRCESVGRPTGKKPRK
jgi:predicted nucleic acid-binding protein